MCYILFYRTLFSACKNVIPHVRVTSNVLLLNKLPPPLFLYLHCQCHCNSSCPIWSDIVSCQCTLQRRPTSCVLLNSALLSLLHSECCSTYWYIECNTSGIDVLMYNYACVQDVAFHQIFSMTVRVEILFELSP